MSDVVLELGSLEVTDALSLSADATGELSVSDSKEIYKDHDVITSYELLDDLPTLDGITIKGAMSEKDPTVPAWAKAESKPAYSYIEVGLEELDTAAIEALWNGL